MTKKMTKRNERKMSNTTLNHPSPDTTSRPAIGSKTSVMIGALYALLAANGVQIAAGLAGIDPSPPPQVLPLLAATVAIGLAALPMVSAGRRGGLVLGIAFCVLSFIGMGPHKLFLEDGLIIAPMALTGFAFEIVFVKAAIDKLRSVG